MTDRIQAALKAGAVALCKAQGIRPTPNEMARARVEAAAAAAAILREISLSEFKLLPPGTILQGAEEPVNDALRIAADLEDAARYMKNAS